MGKSVVHNAQLKFLHLVLSGDLNCHRLWMLDFEKRTSACRKQAKKKRIECLKGRQTKAASWFLVT